MLKSLSTEVKQYLLITANYWSFTLTDGALRMLVVLFFHELGYSPLQIAMLFVFYEVFGIVTNLIGGWLGARIGLNKTMNTGLAMQLIALSMLVVPADWLSVIYVMLAQALSGVAKDLNKMSAKSAIKLLIPEGENTTLFKWVARLTGSKNTLKGFGFFIGGGLLAAYGFQSAIIILVFMLAIVWLISLALLSKDLGKSVQKPKFTAILSKTSAINRLSVARLFLFAARDVWFVVALPVYLASTFGWDYGAVGGFMAVWVIGYGLVQTQAPRIIPVANRRAIVVAVTVLAGIPALISLTSDSPMGLILGLMVFGIVFALNSSLHSFLIVQYADRDSVSMDVGFYYMANAAGRLLGTLLSGWVYQVYGLNQCLWVSSLLLLIAVGFSIRLPDR